MKWSVNNKSGAGANDIKRPSILDSLGWLEPYVVERETASNWQNNSVRMEENDDLEEPEAEQEEEQEDREINASTSTPVNPIQPIPAQAPFSVPSVAIKRTSTVTGRIPFAKVKRKLSRILKLTCCLN